MDKKILHLPLISAAVLLALPLAFAASTFPKTASCPIDGGTAHATGKTSKGTDYSDPRHPQKFNHLFWITHCTE